ncbi:DUF1203 domain-containing protein [Streptomyces angustmyceticus]|uniref:DUF1203 domain-containing protein n=1 Tax=Streptomyces angustmyceticus TaxID=285578 RepID=A0A5J4LDT5_9ACTN|nr:DUF1203 domain-containing protein [Streptomyces angustmyceticus]UAL69184.1 DUF1203 domain-containing protein [Streptomyces angustmyceticus]GES29546.1 hypothetical protein San01_20330 [Streptomyces angustmyceticus]
MTTHTVYPARPHTTGHTALAIPGTALEELRVTDDAGRPAEPFTAREDGVPQDAVGAPLRCCLREVRAGERVALVSYAPLRRWAAGTGAAPGAYDEQGPVFIHAEACGGPDGAAGRYPALRAGALRVLRRYNARGQIIGGRLLEVSEDAQAAFDAALAEAFADPDTALVHVRAVEYGCFHFEVRPVR